MPDRKPISMVVTLHDTLLDRARFLPPADRAMVEMALRSQVSGRQLAAALGHWPGTVHRRLRSLLGRLQNPLVAWLLSPTCALEGEDHQLAVHRFVHRLSYPALQKIHHAQRRVLCQRVAFIEGFFAASRKNPNSSIRHSKSAIQTMKVSSI